MFVILTVSSYLTMVSVSNNLVPTYGPFSASGQVPVITVDQPLYALAKEIQWSKPDVQGKRNSWL